MITFESPIEDKLWRDVVLIALAMPVLPTDSTTGQVLLPDEIADRAVIIYRMRTKK